MGTHSRCSELNLSPSGMVSKLLPELSIYCSVCIAVTKSLRGLREENVCFAQFQNFWFMVGSVDIRLSRLSQQKAIVDNCKSEGRQEAESRRWSRDKTHPSETCPNAPLPLTRPHLPGSCEHGLAVEDMSILTTQASLGISSNWGIKPFQSKTASFESRTSSERSGEDRKGLLSTLWELPICWRGCSVHP